MIVYYPKEHTRHKPPSEIFNGHQDPHAEVPARIETIKKSLETVPGTDIRTPTVFPMRWIRAVHDTGYISYLVSTGVLPEKTYLYPSVFPYAPGQSTRHPAGRRGQYGFDMYTPVSPDTYDAAVLSVMTALSAVSVVAHGERYAYALCRPPGHHAEYAKMGGYCYFGNAAIAANFLSTRGRVAVLDVDVHHGNGTQSLLYHRCDVLTVSIHGNPDTLFPYFTGRPDETGTGNGKGYNLNLPLPPGTEDRSYHTALRRAIQTISAFSPDYLVISIGYDAHVSDPIGGMKLSTRYFGEIGRSIRNLDKPTVLVQEGGYNVKSLGEISRAFVSGLLSSD